jgi:hypothetical protein
MMPLAGPLPEVLLRQFARRDPLMPASVWPMRRSLVATPVTLAALKMPDTRHEV